MEKLLCAVAYSVPSAKMPVKFGCPFTYPLFVTNSLIPSGWMHMVHL